MDYLYHYTSVGVLELILKNRTIRLNPLHKMDDWQEQFSAHGIAHGRHVFISSWTEEEDEIPKMWQDYCKPDPTAGVRLRLPANPFSTTENNLYYPVKSELRLAHENAEKIVREVLKRYPETNRQMFDDFDGLMRLSEYKERLRQDYPDVTKKLIAASEELQRRMTTATRHDVNQLLRKVEYTDEPRKLYPQLYNAYQGQLFGTFDDYGRIKNTSWAWQKEWRYIVGFYRMRAFKRYSDGRLEWYPIPFDYYDLKIDPVKLEELEITTSPVISSDNLRKVKATLNQYAPNTPIKSSVLHSL